jgi:hypothetical protein
MTGCVYATVHRSDRRPPKDRIELDLRTPSGRPMPY